MLCKATAGTGVPVSVTLSIGTTCPFIIFESADINSAVDEVIQTAFKKKKEVGGGSGAAASLLSAAGSLTDFSLCPQLQWLLCVQESVAESVVARLKLRLAGMKCVALRSDADRTLVDAAVQEAQQQGATVSFRTFSLKYEHKLHSVTFKAGL